MRVDLKQRQHERKLLSEILYQYSPQHWILYQYSPQHWILYQYSPQYAAAADSTNCSSNSRSRRWWCYLLARCLFVSTQLWKQLAAGSVRLIGNTDSQRLKVRLYCLTAITRSLAGWRECLQGLGSTLPLCTSAADDLAAQAALPAAELQQVAADQAQLLAVVEALHGLLRQNDLNIPGQHPSNHLKALAHDLAVGVKAEAASETSGSDQAAAAAPAELIPKQLLSLAGQLATFAARVCALLPVQQCCNYHGCSHVHKLSELKLVNGRGCVCSGCRTARYCSRACHKAHWQLWHRPVCKRISKAAHQRRQEQAVMGQMEAGPAG